MLTAMQAPPRPVLDRLESLQNRLEQLDAMKATIDKIGKTQDAQVVRQQSVMQDIDALQAQQRAQDARQLRMLLLLRTLSQQLKVPFDDGLLPEESPP